MAGSKWDREFPAPQLAEAAAPAPKRAIGFAEPDRVEVQLFHPLLVDGERLEVVTVRRITAGEMLMIVEAPSAPSTDAALTRHVLSAMAGQPIEVLESLDPDDAGRLAAAALPFMPAAIVAALERAGEADAPVGEAD